MLKWIGDMAGKPDHPMADVKAARQILAGMPKQDAYKVVEELAGWAESVGQTAGFKPLVRFEILMLIDEAGQAHQRKLTREYLGQTRLPRFREHSLWTATHNFWRYLADAYLTLLEQVIGGAKGSDGLRAHLAPLVLHALYASLHTFKWTYFRYSPAPPELWRQLGRAWQLAEAGGVTQTRLQLYPSIPIQASPQQMIGRLLMLAASSPDGLLPVEIELADRLVDFASPAFVMTTEPGAQSVYMMDLTADKGPSRLIAGTTIHPKMRFIGPGRGFEQLQATVPQLQQHKLPDGLALGAEYAESLIIAVCEHLLLYWSAHPPARKAPRQPSLGRVDIAHGYSDVVRAMMDQAAPAAAQPGLSTQELSILAGREGVEEIVLGEDHEAGPGARIQLESWVVRDVSTGGFGADIEAQHADWLRVGALLASSTGHPSTWQLGIIRRLQRQNGTRAHVGVQVQAYQPYVVRIAEMVSRHQAPSQDSFEYAVLLDTTIEPGQPLRLVTRAASFEPGSYYQIQIQEACYTLQADSLVERGDDYEFGVFRLE